MNWEAIGAIAEIVGAAAVFLTLLYLAKQLREGNEQREIEAFRHTWDNLNQFCDTMSRPEVGPVVIRGRESRSGLSPEERLIFDHVHLRMLNTLESWHLQVIRTTKPGAFRDTQLENLAGLVSHYFQHPGTRDLWAEVGWTFVPIGPLVDKVLATPPGDDAEKVSAGTV